MNPPIYRIVLIADYWRLMRDDKLVATYTTQALAKAGMAAEQRRDAARGAQMPLAAHATVRAGGGAVVELWTAAEQAAVIECGTAGDAHELAAMVNRCAIEVWRAK